MTRNLYRLAGFLAVVCASLDVVAGDEMFLGSMTPPAIQRGATTRVVLDGAELGRALDVWTSAPGAKIRAKKISGDDDAAQAVFDVTADNDAPLGLHGLRLATDDGLSNAILFLVDDLKPTEAPAEASLKLPAAVYGSFRPTEIDRFTIDVAANEELTFECVASRFGKDADPLLRILDAHGKLVVEYDNDPGLFFDFRFAHKFAEAGRYTLELGDARYHGHAEWKYLLRIGRFPAERVTLPGAATPKDAVGRFYREVRRPGDVAASWVAASASSIAALAETEPNDTPEQAVKTAAPVVLCGVFDKTNDVDYYEFELKKGDRLALRAESAALDSPADVELAAVGSDGKEMSRVDDVLLEEASLTFAANKDGPYRVWVRDVTRSGGPAFTYRVEVRKAGPQLALVADFADLTIPQGDYQSFPLILTRTEYKGPVKLALVGAPSGVVLEPNEIAEDQTMLWARVRASDKAPLGIGTLQIVASAEVEGETVSTIARTSPLVDRQRYNVDLIKYALRENQRRLPPSLSDRVALQITPPSPFTVETPDAVVTLVRYLTARFPIHVVFKPYCETELAFKAVGGQLGEESEIRRQVYTRFTPATSKNPIAYGTFYSRNLPQDRIERVDLSTAGELNGRRVRLVRSFDLDLRPGYKVTASEKGLVLAPGEKKTVVLTVDRHPSFTGPVTIEPTPVAGLAIPEQIIVAANETTANLDLDIPADMAVGRPQLRLFFKAKVGEFQEEGTPLNLGLEIKIPPPPKPEPKKK